MRELLVVVVMMFVVAGQACMSAPKKAVPKHKGLSDKTPGSREYDREAFLGRDGARKFGDLDKEESVRQLALLAVRIDADGDGLVDNAELVTWINVTHNKYIRASADAQFEDMDPEGEGWVKWSAYDSPAYGFIDSGLYELEDVDVSEMGYLRARDEMRWRQADQDGDMRLTRDEFRAFMYPEEFAHTRPNYVRETLDQIDKDHDQGVDVEEYLADVMSPEDRAAHPEWVEVERERFHSARDRNRDGKLDVEEVEEWLFPLYSEVESEARHLIETSDADKDGKLSVEEIIANHDTFAGSKATEWGEALRLEL